jgi:hypothetical protein
MLRADLSITVSWWSNCFAASQCPYAAPSLSLLSLSRLSLLL